MSKHKKAVSLIQKVADFEKGNINMISRMQSKPRVISMDGFWDIAFILEMSMTVERLRHCMKK